MAAWCIREKLYFWFQVEQSPVELTPLGTGRDIPADTRRKTNVFMTSKRRRDVILTS